MKSVFVTAAARTPMGGLGGSLSALTAGELGGAALKAVVENSSIPSEVVMGNVLMAGQGQAPARQAVHAAGLEWSVPATTVNKMCGSGMQAAMQVADRLLATGGVMAAGGMESMSQAPYLVSKARSGLRMGHAAFKDSMFLDGLEDAYTPGQLMGVFAEQTARDLGLTREEQDNYALLSLERARQAAEGAFASEIVSVEVRGRKSSTVVSSDEQLVTARPEKIPTLRPAFAADGTVTAANASSISDGAAALMLQADGAAPSGAIAKWVGQVTHAELPEHFTIAPITAINKLLTQVGWGVNDVDLFEVNEAFAVVALAARNALNIEADRFNVHGGACALGHPIGASGARIIVTLLNALQTRGLKRGVAAVCIGGGEATAIAVELV